MTPYEIKRQLGYGTLSKVARKLHVSLGHVSQVVTGRRSPRVEKSIARRLGKRPEDVFPVEQEAA